MRWALATLVFFAFSCRTIDTANIEATYYDQTPIGDETYTRARLRALNIYAQDVLSEFQVERDANGKLLQATKKLEPLHAEAKKQFEQRGLDPAPLLPLNKPGNPQLKMRGHYNFFLAEDSDSCFWEGSLDRDIYWGDHVRQLRAQVLEVGRFIKDFHVAIDGDVLHDFVFFDVELCSKKRTGRLMSWRGNGKIDVGIPYWTWFTGGDYEPVTSRQLMDIWNSGGMFDAKVPDQAAVRLLWPILNPAGDFHRMLVAKLKTMRDKALQAIDSKLKVNVQLSEDAFSQLLRTHIAFDRLDFKLNDVLAKTKDPEVKRQLMEAWRKAIAEPDRLRAISNASIPAVSGHVQVKNHAKGWLVSVANYHRISVQVSSKVEDQGSFLRVNDPRNVNLDQECTGAFAICTIDDVSVIVDFVRNNVGFEMSLETSGFAEAARTILGL